MKNLRSGIAAAQRGRSGIVVTSVLLLIAGGAAFYTWLTLHWSYSEGERAGVLQKFSRKGWICKTYEGELALYLVGGLAPQIWNFSVRDDQVVQQLQELVGTNVRVHYSEHRGLPTSCFGDTRYFAERAVEVGAHAPPQVMSR